MEVLTRNTLASLLPTTSSPTHLTKYSAFVTVAEQMKVKFFQDYGTHCNLIIRQETYYKSTAVLLHNAGIKGKRSYSSYFFLTSTLDGVSGLRHTPAALNRRGKDPGTHCTGGWVGPRAGLDTEARGKILCLCRGSNPSRSVCIQTLQ
jgi:hypothetical protein